MSTPTTSTPKGDRIFVGKKPIHVYEAAALAALKNHPSITVIARGILINNAILVAENVRKRKGGTVQASIGVTTLKNKADMDADVPFIELVFTPKS